MAPFLQNPHFENNNQKLNDMEKSKNYLQPSTNVSLIKTDYVFVVSSFDSNQKTETWIEDDVVELS